MRLGPAPTKSPSLCALSGFSRPHSQKLSNAIVARSAGLTKADDNLVLLEVGFSRSVDLDREGREYALDVGGVDRDLSKHHMGISTD